MNRAQSNGDFEQKLHLARNGDDDSLSDLLTGIGPRVRCEIQIAPVWNAYIDADDIMQVTYMEAFMRIGSFAGNHEEVFLAWLVQLARNNLHDAIRALDAQKRPSPKRQISSSADESYAQLIEAIGVTTSTPSRAVSKTDMRRLIDDALGQLPRDYAEVIRLLDLEGLSGEEVSERLGRSRAAVYMLVGRARDRLRELLGAKSQYF